MGERNVRWGTVGISVLLASTGIARLGNHVWLVLFGGLAILLLGSSIVSIPDTALGIVGGSLTGCVGLYWLTRGDLLLGGGLLVGTLLVIADYLRKVRTDGSGTLRSS
ncbi:hypothetical protein A6E15_09520 [Natrinema saccharevitans]|uniref:Uncharacterized protein n=1 Tax=Natrinema saccharevitans TaxID=301967 RepID=A0A1S8AXE3_9EURY|nr:hypothetical protein A6E15_09520 [Natrinema saccharevitans]